ncbi:MAG TPA: acyl-CoA dehydrogenase family protein [Nocardioidaceae bacterium]|nr:acyl-CoA dehydrogenase family protein [Nocardioidaceae bacterium]
MTSDLNLLYTDVEDDLRSSVRDLLRSRCSSDAVTAMYDGDRSVVDSVWRSVAVELGLAGLLVPESAGGAGASAREAAVVLEELGRVAAPVPFLTSSVVAAALLPEGELLAALAEGTRTAALAVPLPTTPWAFRAAVKASGDSLSGEVRSVAGALEADVLLVPVESEGGLELRAVEASAAVIDPVVSLDMSRQVADVSFESAPSQVVVPAASGEAALREALQVGAALLASEQVGIAQWCLETTVAYLKERRQFGRVVGGFQALKHRLADMYVMVEQARAAARYAAVTAAEGDPDAEVAGSLAQAYCSDVAVKVAEECVQLHGGIGMTWEHPAHLYLKRAKADQIAFGTASEHRAHLATLVDLPVT